jgi:hypothetical protein
LKSFNAVGLLAKASVSTKRSLPALRARES